MKIVEPKYEILTDISEGGIKELQQIERVARVCYKSEDKITPDGESAKKLVRFLVKQEHEAMLEHGADVRCAEGGRFHQWSDAC